MKVYWQLFYTFFRIGAFTIGGGYAMIPLIQKEVVNHHKWLNEKDFIDMLALTQSSPGVIAINVSIFIGYKLKGFRGSLMASLGAILPSFFIILAIAAIFVELDENVAIERIFKGLRPAVVALIAAPVWRMAKAAGITWRTAFIPIGAAVLIYFGLSPALIISAGIIAGVFITRWQKKHSDTQNHE